MKDCIKKDVCKHAIVLGDDPNGPCIAVATCRYIIEVPDSKKEKPAKRAYKKRGVRGHYKSRGESDPPLHEEIDDDSGITEKQFKQAKKKIANARQNKGLNENQESALKAMKRMRFKKMTGTQKQQILNIAKYL